MLNLPFSSFCIIQLNNTKNMFQSDSLIFPSTSASSPHLYTFDLLIGTISRVVYFQAGGILLHYSDRSLSSIAFSIFSTKYLNIDNIDENLLKKKKEHKMTIVLFCIQWFRFTVSQCAQEKSPKTCIKR